MNKRACTHTVLLILWFGCFITGVAAQDGGPSNGSTTGPSTGQNRYFRSNSLGMALQEITEYRINEYEYVLKRTRGEAGLTEILLKAGKEHQRAEYQWKGAVQYGRFYEQGRLIRETVETAGRLQEERLFVSSDSNEEFERRVYEWVDGELQRVKVYRNDAVQTIEEYIRSQEGKLLQVLQSGPDGAEQVSAVYSLPDGQHTQWHFTAGGRSYFFYSEQGNRISEEYLRGNLVYRKETLQGEERTIVSELYPEQDKRVRSVYGPDGKILSSQTDTPTTRIHAEYSYRDGELTEMLRRENGAETRVLYDRGEGDQPDERIYVNEVLQKEVRYRGGKRRTEVLYRNGEAVARVEYRGEEAVERESLIEDDR